MGVRSKVVEATGFASLVERLGVRAAYVCGFFDPLLAAHARRLAGLKQDKTLVVVLADPPDPILPAGDRATMLAALRDVDYVVLPATAGRAVLETTRPPIECAVAFDYEHDQMLRAELTQTVAGRREAAGEVK